LAVGLGCNGESQAGAKDEEELHGCGRRDISWRDFFQKKVNGHERQKPIKPPGGRPLWKSVLPVKRR
jgi:hypothetical protein